MLGIKITALTTVLATSLSARSFLTSPFLTRSILTGSLLTGSLLLIAPLQAADTEGNYAIRGAGSFTCERYMTAVDSQSDDVRQFVRWMEGYATALNRLQPDTFDVSPLLETTAMANLILTVCQQIPEMAFETAVAQSLSSLAPLRERAESDTRTLTHNDLSVPVRQETLRRVQQALRSLGHYTSTVDGLYGPGTRRAITTFQENAGLTVTGLPDPDTLLVLLLTRDSADE